MLLDQSSPGWHRSTLLGQAPQSLQTEQPVLGGETGRMQDALFGVGAGQHQGSLDEADRAHSTLGVSLLGPVPQLLAHLSTAAEKAHDERFLRRSLGWWSSRGRSVRALQDTRVDGDLDLAEVDADEPLVPPHPDVLAQQMDVLTWQMRGHRVVPAADLDMTVRVDRARAGLEEGERLGRERGQGRFVGLKVVRVDLPARRAVDPNSGDGSVPVPQMCVQFLDTVEAPTLQSVVLDVPPASLLLAVFLRIAGAGRKWREAPMPGEGGLHLVDVGIVEAGTDDGRLQIVMANDTRDPAKVAEGVLVQGEEAVELLVPDGLLVAVT